MQSTNPIITRSAKKDGEAIKLPILIPLFASILLLLLIFTFAIYHLQRKHIRDDVQARLDNVSRYFNQFLASDARLIGETTHFVKDNPDIKNAWLAKDRNALLTLTAPIFEKLRQDHRITHLYFIDVNQTCFLRVHNPPRFGDRITRFTLESASSTTKPSWGIELGPYGTFTLRVVQPWFVNNTLTGFIEFGEEIEHIAPQLKNVINVDLAFLIDKSLLNHKDWQEGFKMMGHTGDWDLMPNCVIADSTVPEVPSEFTKLAGLPHYEHQNRILTAKLNGSTFSAGFVKLSDAAGREVGDILVIKNITKEQASLRILLEAVATISFLIASALISFFYIHISGIEKRLFEARAALIIEIEKRKEVEAELRKHRDNLEKNIENRTAELEETNKRLHEENLERKKAEEIIRRERDLSQASINSLPGLFYIFDNQGRFMRINKNFEKVSGYSADEISRMTPLDFFGETDKRNLVDAIQRTFQTGESTVEADFLSKDQTKTPYFFTGKLFQFDQKPYLIGMGIDITKRKRAEEELLETNRHLQQENDQRIKVEKSLEKLNADLASTVTQLSRTNKQLGEFAHLTAHDLKTPLRGIGTLAQWLHTDYSDKFDDNGHRQIDLLVKRVMRMDNIINAILQYSETTRGKLKERKVDLNILLKAVIDKINPPENIKITINNTLPVLICEEEHLRQIFHNLISNAVNFSDKPQTSIIIDVEDEKHFWKFSVADNGPGIEPQHFERIFQLFQMLNNRDDVESQGVGLTLTKKIVEFYDGKIWLTSKVGIGSTFFFTLPKQMTASALQTPQPTFAKKN